MRIITLIALTFIFHLGKAATDQADKSSKQLERGQSIMQEVFIRFHTNYEMSRLHKMGYYQESVSDSSSIYYLAEGIVDIYIPSNLNQIDNADIYPIKTRKQAFKDIEADKLLFGNASDMARSSIWRPDSFLSEKNRNNYSFSYAGETIIKNYEVAIIEFEPAEGTQGKVKGRIFIDQSYYGIIKIEYIPLITHSKIWKEVSWSENFEFKNGAYALMNVKFKGTSAFDDFHYEAILAMDQLEVISKIPQHMVFIGDNVSLFAEAKETSSDSFWEGFEFLKKSIPIEENYLIAENH